MPRKIRMTRKVFEVLLHGELLEGEVDCHCPICGKYADDLFAQGACNVVMSFNEVEGRWEPYEEILGWGCIIVECTCGFVADDSFFSPNLTFPELKYDGDSSSRYVAAGTFRFKVIETNGEWTFPNSKVAYTYFELLQIVNAGTISELPTSLVSDVEWLRRLASSVFDKLKYKRPQSGVPKNPY